MLLGSRRDLASCHPVRLVKSLAKGFGPMLEGSFDISPLLHSSQTIEEAAPLFAGHDGNHALAG